MQLCGIIVLRNPTKNVLHQYVEGSYRRRLIPGMAQHQGVVGGLTPSCGESVTPDCGLIDHWPERIHSVCCTDVQGLFRRRLIPGMAQHNCVVGGVTPSCGEGVTLDCGVGARFSKMSP